MDKSKDIVNRFSLVQPADNKIQKMSDGVRRKARHIVGETFAFFKAISYRSQIVMGKIYLVTVQVSYQSFVILEIFKSPEDKISLLDATAVLFERKIPVITRAIAPPHSATPRIQSMVDGTKQEVEFQTGQTFELFNAVSFRAECLEGISYKTACSQGINYLVVVQVSENSVLQLGLYEGLNGVVKLNGIKKDVAPCIPGPFYPVPGFNMSVDRPTRYSVPMKKIRTLANGFQAEVEEQLGRNFSIFTAISFHSDVHEGINYHIAVMVESEPRSYTTIQLFESLGGQVHLTSVSQVRDVSILAKNTQPYQMLGLFGYNATRRIQDMVDQLDGELRKAGLEFDTLKAITFNSCVSEGINFLIKVEMKNKDNGSSHVRLGIYESLYGKIFLTGISKSTRSDSDSSTYPFYPIPQSVCEPASKSIQKMINAYKKEAEEWATMTFEKFRAISYRTFYRSKLDNGVYYYVSVMVSDDSFVELEIFKSFEGVTIFRQLIEGIDQYDTKIHM